MNIQPHLVVMGVSGAGKTTIAKRLAELLHRPFGEADDMHSPANIAKMSAGFPLTDDDRRPWLSTVRDWLSEQARQGKSGVVACSALRRAYRDVLREAEGTVCFVHLDADPRLVARHLGERQGHFMPPTLLESQLEALEPLQPDERGVRVSIKATPQETVAEALRAIGNHP